MILYTGAEDGESQKKTDTTSGWSWAKLLFTNDIIYITVS